MSRTKKGHQTVPILMNTTVLNDNSLNQNMPQKKKPKTSIPEVKNNPQVDAQSCLREC